MSLKSWRLVLLPVLIWMSTGCALRPRLGGEPPTVEVDSPVLTGAEQEALSGVRELILRRMEEQELPSVAVAVGRDGEVLWSWAAGWADRKERIAASPWTPYSLASISKPITATGLMVLVERGLVDLDAPVNQYLGETPLRAEGWDAGAATVRQVLQHAAGLPLHYQFFYEGRNPDPPAREETIRRYGVLMTAPGEAYQYSNLGYGILDHVITRVTGDPFPDFLAAEVFGPLGMEQSAAARGTAPPPEAARRYDGDGRPIPDYDFDHAGASALYASAVDLVRFGMWHLKQPVEGADPVVSEAGRDRMQQEGFPTGNLRSYALGWSVRAADHGHRTVAHTGGMPGVSTALKLVPEAGVVVAILCNSRMGGQGGIVDALIHSLEPSYRGPVETLAGTWTGRIRNWSGDQDLALRVEADGAVFGALDGGKEVRLEEVRITAEGLAGRMAGALTNPDASREPHAILLDLRRRGDRLAGSASARSNERLGEFALTSFAELRRGSGPGAEALPQPGPGPRS